MSFHHTLFMHFSSAILILRHASTATRVTQKPPQIIIPKKSVSCRTPLLTVHHFKSLPISYREARKKIPFKCGKLLTSAVILFPSLHYSVTFQITLSVIYEGSILKGVPRCLPLVEYSKCFCDVPCKIRTHDPISRPVLC